MKKIILIVLLPVFVKAIYCQSVNTSLISQELPLWQTGKIYVKIVNNSNEDLSNYPSISRNDILDILSQYGVTNIEKPFAILNTPIFDRTYRITFTDTLDVDSFILKLAAVDVIEYAEKVPMMYQQIIPNDPMQLLTGQQYLSLINADGASNIHQTNPGAAINTIVAIVDDAVLTTHEDLAANIFTLNRDVANLDNDPNPPFFGLAITNGTRFSHGTNVAGIAAGVTNNNLGIASVGWSNHIMAVKTRQSNDFSTSLPFAYDGVAWAIANGAQVINMSWGGGAPSESENNIMINAQNNNIVLIAAAGNNGIGNAFYPAAYGEGLTLQPWEVLDRTLVVAVAALDNNNDRSIWPGSYYTTSSSNLGQWVDISAYGTGILSSISNSSGGNPINNQYTNLDGTSMAAPMVSGVAGLMRSYNPTATLIDIYNCLVYSANPDIYNTTIHPTNSIGTMGYGRLDAEAALKCLGVPCTNNPIAVIIPSATTICPGGTVTLTANQGVSYLWSTGEITQTITVNTAGIYTVTITFVGGCTASTSLDIFDVNTNLSINVFENSDVPNDGIICGAGGFFNGFSLCASATGSSYTWNPYGFMGWGQCTGGLGIAVSTSITYTVSVTDMNGCVGLNGTASFTVQALPPPFTTAVTPSMPQICAGQSVQLTASGANTYIWFPALGLSSQTLATVTASPTTTTTYTVLGRDVNGCQDVATVTVTVNPVPTITITPSTSSICVGQSTTLTASGADTYTWSPSTGLSGTTGAMITANPATQTTYSVIGIDANGCSSTSSVTVDPLPTISPSVPTICSGQTSNLSINLPNPTSIYNWYDAGTGGNLLGTGTSYTTPVLSTTTTFYLEEINTFCTNVRTPVVVTVLIPDLYIADSPVDIGNEPDAETAASFGNVFWNSSDIWIRQINDGFALANQVSEPIEYTNGVPNYIYVRVKNKGFCPQTADLRVYWAKASTGLSWPSQWDNYNTTYAGCAASLYGEEITPSINITVPAQSEQIFEIPWEPKNPDDYNCFVDPFHFCLLGRIETTTVAPYGMTFPEGSSVWSNTVDNNNIAWKNVIINNNNPGKFVPFGTTIIRNVDEKANFINLNFASQKDDIGQHLIDFKRIQLYCSKDFIKRWAEGGKRGKDIVLVNDSVVEILSVNATMENIFLRYNEIGAVSLALETKKDPVLSNDKYFNFDIIQYSRGEKIPQGGQTYQIKKGVSRKDCLTPAHEVSKIILGNQVYSDSILINGNITVPYGATLNFKKAIVMLTENASINVMPGGKLIIDASRLESSCIGKKWAGIDVKGAPAFQNPLIIQNSFIAGSDSPLSLDKTQGILISRTTFLGDNIGTAIVMNKMKDFKIFENTFSNFITGIKTTNTSEADVKSIVEKNIFLNVKIALDFTQDKHTKLDIKCNRFSYTDYAILSDQTLLKDQGVIGEGAGNEFISNSTLANNKLQHTNGNSPKYYYDPSQPITSGMNVTTLLSTTDRVCYTYSFDTSSTISLQRLSALSNQNEVISEQGISVYSVPNPNTGKSTIFYNLGGEKQGDLVIMDIYGKIIGQIKVTSESNKIDVDYSGYATGVYLISLKNSKGDLTNQKMIIAK